MRARIQDISEFILRLNCVFLLTIALSMPGFAQLSTATVKGIVQDSSKASLPDARLKLINAQTGTENDSITNSQGGFILPGILPGAYTLQIEHLGFATTQIYGILLNVGDTKDLLIRMKIGPVTESVTVDASGLTLNATDASVSTVVDRRFVANVPLNGRSFQDLISMTPGVVTQSPQATGQGANTQGDFSVNGQRTESNAFFVDGVSANMNSGLASGHSRLSTTGSAAGSTALGTTQSLVSIDALQEFRVLSSTYSAEYGRTPGGQFTFLTRSGTNTTHGGLYGYFRNSALDAADWFSTLIQHQDSTLYPPETYNQADFGGTLGAPIVLPGTDNGQARTFMFLSYEGLYLAQPTPQTYQYTPRSCFYTPGCPLHALWNTFPSPGPGILDASGNPAGLSQTILPSYALPAHVNSTSFRVDETFSPKLSMFLRYAGTPSYSQTRQLWSVTANHVDTQTFTFGAAHQLSQISSNEFRLGFAGNHSTVNTQTDPLEIIYTPPPDLNTALGIPASDDSVRGEAYIHIAGVGDSESDTDQRSSSLYQWNIRDTFSLQWRNHIFKFGVDQRRVVSSVHPPALSVQAAFLDTASIENNLPSDLVITKSNPASPVLNEFSAFAEDQWKMSQVLTLSLGLRSELNPPPKGEHGKDAFTLRGDVNHPATLTLLPRGTPLWHATWYNFAPRLGAAWAIRNQPGRELLLRAGGGVFFDTGNRPGLSAFNGIGFTASTHSNSPLPVTPAELDFSTAVIPPYSNTTAFAFPSHLQLPYSLQWDIGLEKALNKNQSLTISYVGAEGRRLLQEQRRNVNPFNSNFADVSYYPAGVTSSYQALQAKFQRSLSRGVEALAAYTWAHSLDYGSTDPRFPLVRGNSDLDVRHNVEGAVSWDLPRPAANNLIKRKLLADWGVDGRLIARTSFPVNLSGNFFFDAVTGDTYYSGVNLIRDRPLYLSGSKYPGGRIFNGGRNAVNPAFSLPDGGSQGDAPRNYLRGFDLVQTNITARRDIHFADRWNMRFGAEIFNVLNHPNFGYIDPYLTDLLFGQSTKMLNQSFGGTGSLYQQGGPRSIQFSLKFMF